MNDETRNRGGSNTQAQERRQKREEGEKSEDPTGGALTDRERDEVQEHRRLSAVTVYAILYAEGEEELGRPINSLWWSGIVTGIAISTSLLAEAILLQTFEGHPRQDSIALIGYSAGFVIVILARLQLFTENTISVILPLLADWSVHRLWCTARLWGVVMLANLLGTFVTALATIHLVTTSPEYIAAMLELSRKQAEIQGWRTLILGIPAGFYIAALVWLLPSSKGFEIFTIIFITWLIAAGGFTHVIVGSSKIFMVIVSGELPFLEGLMFNLLPAFAGNVLGGTGLFAVLAYAQVSQEM